MSLPRFAAGGAVGGLLLWGILAGLWGGRLELVNGLAISFTLLGAGSAAGSLALARRADDGELLEHGEDVADIGLTPRVAEASTSPRSAAIARVGASRPRSSS